MSNLHKPVLCTLPDGQFMGNVVHRTQHLAGDRVFTPIPVTYMQAASQSRAGGPQDQAEQALLGRADHIADAMRYGTAVHKLLVAAKVSSPPVIQSTPRQMGKSFFDKIMQGVGKTVKFKRPIPDYYVYANPALARDLAMMSNANTTPVPECSAYEHADRQRQVPVLRLDVSPTFYMDSSVEDALVNSIEAVCGGLDMGLSRRVRELIMAEYVPLSVYKPDVDPMPAGFGASSSIFHRDTVILPVAGDGSSWVLDMRSAPGVYAIGDDEWLGVFVHGIANRIPSKGRGMKLRGGLRHLMPGEKLEAEYAIHHRGQLDPHSLYFDMFVPVEPKIVTEQWGWGGEMEELAKAKADNAMADAKSAANNPTYGGGRGNAWDKKARNHKTATQIAREEALNEHRDYELALKVELAQAQRERARKVLYKFAWKALMLATIECKQMIVETR